METYFEGEKWEYGLKEDDVSPFIDTKKLLLL